MRELAVPIPDFAGWERAGEAERQVGRAGFGIRRWGRRISAAEGIGRGRQRPRATCTGPLSRPAATSTYRLSTPFMGCLALSGGV